ncbi:receptor subunit beta-type acr [Seminavis robusta]|uniref:Receptor subunit beta-type acr n=1 Tax=Seminavis robusta TaxID=568900 RepID=A0A9N8HUH8_9STRA|nr:receptor subunit beta-type acr [Seminavis robusta]|eukprot:Sro1385_g268200.1 receptor subunit beta-type acr (1039) ;mRNA; f:13560-16676
MRTIMNRTRRYLYSCDLRVSRLLILVVLLLLSCATQSSTSAGSNTGTNSNGFTEWLQQEEETTVRKLQEEGINRGTVLDIIPVRYNDEEEDDGDPEDEELLVEAVEELDGLGVTFLREEPEQDLNATLFSNDTTTIPTSSTTETVVKIIRGPGTNFQHTVPYNFTHIFLVGGHCNVPGEEEWVAGDWYTKFVGAGMETLGVPVENNICSNVKGNAYTRDFHVEALWQVQALVGNQLNETLVITAAIGLESDWSPVADLLRQGMSFFHAKEDAQNFDLKAFGLDTRDVLYYYFRWDEAGSAERAGRELCRVKGGTQQLKVAKLLTGGRNGSLDYRVNLAIDTYTQENNCAHIEIVNLWTVYDNVTDQALKTTLIFNPFPDIIFTAQDQVAKRIIDIARNALSPDQFSRIATTGWDNIEEQLLNDYKILTTVDQLVHYPGKGLWGVFKTVIGILEETGLNSTKTIQDELDLGESLTISSDTLTISSDRVGFLISNLLQGYDAGYPPFQEVEVSSGLYDVTITKMIPFEGKFEAVLWLQTSWHDPRLEWNYDVYSGTLPMDPETIWTPRLYFQNEFDNEDLYTAPAIITHTGKVTMRQNMMAEFLCSTTEDLRSFPFDIYSCAIVLGAPASITLDYKYGFEVIEVDPHFTTTTATSLDEEVGTPDPPGARSEFVYYQMIFERRPFIAYVRLILPAVLINMVGFMAFWIPEMQESVALGITSLLCSLTFRETVEMPDTADVTWTEVFMMLNVSYQASVMFIIWCSYGHSNKVAAALDHFFGFIHPVKVFRWILQLPFLTGRYVAEKTIIKPANVQPRDYNQAVRPVQYGVSPTTFMRRDKFGRSFMGLPQQQQQPQQYQQPIAEPMYTNDNTRDLVANELYNSGNASLSSFAGDDHETANHTALRASTHLRSQLRGMDTISGADGDEDDWEFHGASRHTRRLPPASADNLYGDVDPNMYDNDNNNKDTKGNYNINASKTNNPKGKKEIKEPKDRVNVDWIGRWFIFTSYVIVTATLLATGWGFYDTPGAASAAILGVGRFAQ